MSRRKLLLAGVAGTASGLLPLGWRRLARPAPPDGPLSDAAQALLARAWQGLDPSKVIDCHVHVVGLGTGGSGCYVSPHMRSLARPLSYARFDIYRRAAGIRDLARADQDYAEGLVRLASQPSPRGKLLLLAFDHAYRQDGSRDDEATEFHVPNDYVLALCDAHPALFVPCASIHPYRRDAVAELERVVARGARSVKWLPSAMRLDPAAPACDAFYRRLAELGVPLLTHAGDEAAVDVAEAQALSNPLRLRRALDAGVTVIVCHCATTGDGEDLDAPGGAPVPNAQLFLRLLGEARYQRQLYGDISALTQFNRCDKLADLLARTELHGRLINGSDYPLPAINVLVQTSKLLGLGLIGAEERAALDEINRHNPILFDFALKRSLRAPGGVRFADSVFMPTLFQV